MPGERGITPLSEHGCFGGVQGYYQHDSEETGTPMKFGVFVPPQAKAGPVPVLFFLADLTCSEETFAIKSGARQHAASHGLMLVRPDTSPHGTGARLPPLLIDQGLADKFLAEQLHPHLFEAACLEAGQPLELRRHEGYDHSYFFISTFMADHIAHHARFPYTA